MNDKVKVEDKSETPEVIEVNEAEGKTKTEFMNSDYGKSLPYPKNEEYWKKFGASSKVTGFRAKFYDRLRAGNLSTKGDNPEALKFAETDGGSLNDIKQITHYYAIAELASDIREIVRAEVEAEFAKSAKK